MTTATLHLVCGSTGAGKTTHALRLVQEHGALHFSIDDWMVRLFGADRPPRPDWPWIAERLARCERLIVESAVAPRRMMLTGYRAPAETAEVGNLGEDESAKARRLKEAQGKKSGLARLIPWL